jgi:hypothetical protein
MSGERAEAIANKRRLLEKIKDLAAVLKVENIMHTFFERIVELLMDVE